MDYIVGTLLAFINRNIKFIAKDNDMFFNRTLIATYFMCLFFLFANARDQEATLHLWTLHSVKELPIDSQYINSPKGLFENHSEGFVSPTNRPLFQASINETHLTESKGSFISLNDENLMEDIDLAFADDLYVDPSLGFDSYKDVMIEINAKGNSGKALKDTMLTISAVTGRGDEVIENQEIELQEKPIIIKSFIDNISSINISLEVPKNINNLLLKLNTLGKENEVIYALSDSNKIVYNVN